MLTMPRAHLGRCQAQWELNHTYHGGRTTGAVFTVYTACSPWRPSDGYIVLPSLVYGIEVKL